MVLVVGEKERTSQSVSVRQHKKGDIGTVGVSEFTASIVKEIAEKLSKKLGSEHEAQHLMMDCLGQVMWESQREGKPLNPENYLEALRKLC